MSSKVRTLPVRLSDSTVGFLLVLPSVLVLCVLLIYPLLDVVHLSFSDVVGPDRYVFVGLKHYIRLFHDREVWQALGNSVLFTTASVILHLVVGMAVALLLNQNIRGRAFFRVVALIPWMFSSVVVALTWQWLLDPQFGLINAMLLKWGITNQPILWLESLRLAMPSVVMANLWRGFPFAMVMLLAGLQAVPKEQYEAAAVDGASPIARFRFITLPNLRYIITITAILDTIWNFKHFDLVQVMTNGGPVGQTEVLVTKAYKVAFQNFEFGYAAAIAVVVFLVMLLFTTLYIRTIRE